MVAIGWLMVYYGYPHLLDGFGANFDITDPDRPTVVLYGNFGSKVEPPAPDIRVSPERGWEVARQSMQEHWTRTHPGLKMDLRLLQGEEGIPKRYVYRRDLYTGDAPRNPEESHLVYVVRARAMWDPVQVGAKWPAGESRPAFEVWVDCTDAEIVGAHFVSLPPEDGGQEDEVKRWLEYRNIPSIPQSSRLRAP